MKTSISKKFFKGLLATALLVTSISVNVTAETETIDIYMKPGDIEYITGHGDYDATGINSDVAKVELLSATGGDQIAQLGNNDLYDGEFTNLSNALYTFTPQEGKVNEYVIRSVRDGSIYLSVNSDNWATYHSNTPESIQLKMVDTLHGKQFGFFNSQRSRCLFFQALSSGNKRIDHYYWYTALTQNEISLLFHIYEMTVDDGNISYIPVTDMPEEGKQYVIATQTYTNNVPDTDYRYALYPTMDLTSPYKQVAKWHVEEKAESTKEVKITAVSDGVSSFVIGNKTYKVHVAKVPYKVENTDALKTHDGKGINKLSISTGSTYLLEAVDPSDVQYWMSGDDQIATIENGNIVAIGTKGQWFGKTWAGYVDKDNEIHSIEVVVFNQALSANKKELYAYMEVSKYTDASYAMFTKDMVDQDHTWIDNDIKAAIDKEVFFVEFDENEEYGLVFFAKTSEDREFAHGDIKVDSTSYTAAKVETATALDCFKETFKDENVDGLLTLAKNNGWQVIVPFVKPIQNRSVSLNSSYIIDISHINGNTEYQTDYTKTYEIKKSMPLESQLPALKDDFGLSDTEFEKTFFVNFDVTEDDVTLNEVTLTKPIDIEISLPSEMVTYDHSKIASRTYKVSSIHGSDVLNWNTFTLEGDVLTVKVNKFSTFAVTAVDTPVPTPEPVNPNPGYLVPDTSCR